MDQKLPRSRRADRGRAADAMQLSTDADLIVLSPGVPADLDVVDRRARARQSRVIGDLELASWFLQGEIIGITGSNGKTTTTALTGHILQASGIAAQVGGNIGTPPASMVKTSRAGQWNVLELSSFQLETTETFRAAHRRCLNVTPDHLDRHYTLENYADAKARLFVQSARRRFRGAECRRSHLPRLRGARRGEAGVVQLDADGLAWRVARRRPDHAGRRAADADLAKFRCAACTISKTRWPPPLIARLAGATHAQIRAAVMTFPGRRASPGIRARAERRRLVQRFESDQRRRDAEGDRTRFHGGLWMILGGKDKNSDYTLLAAPLKAKAHAALLIGAAADKIEDQLNGAIPLIALRDLEAAMHEAHCRAQLAAIPCCSRRPAPASISSKISSIAAASSNAGAGVAQR